MTAPRTPADPGAPESSDPKPLPADAEPGSDDGVLDSIGKAITSPVRGAAEPEEPGRRDGEPPVPPG